MDFECKCPVQAEDEFLKQAKASYNEVELAWNSMLQGADFETAKSKIYQKVVLKHLPKHNSDSEGNRK